MGLVGCHDVRAIYEQSRTKGRALMQALEAGYNPTEG
jgi:hypothetical protein